MYKKTKVITLLFFVSIFFFSFSISVDAATLKAFPSTGIYSAGSSFSVSIFLNTNGKSVNAADGQLTFNPKELQILNISRSGSIFNLWTQEPTFSNTTGIISFGGGSPAGYKGSSGRVFTMSLRALNAGTPKMTFKSGSVLAADGLGTNILTSMNGGTYTISAVTTDPQPEYIAPANTPKAPNVTSSSHPDKDGWFNETTAILSWSVPDDVISIRTLLSSSPNTIPTKVYTEIIEEKIIENLDEGVSYFHIQFKNSDGWGRITHYRLGVDTEAPKDLKITIEDSTEIDNPGHVLTFTYEDISPILEYKVQIDGADPKTFTDEDGDKKILIDTLPPGHHTVVVEAFDAASNSIISSLSFKIEAFDKPIFTEYPTRINTGVIPAIKGVTRPDADIAITIKRDSDGSFVFANNDDENLKFTIRSDSEGLFTYIPPKPFDSGVYRISAIARDSVGKLSEVSDEIKIIVEVPGYIMFGTIAVNTLSIIVPFVALLILLIFGSWYLWHRLIVWKNKVRKETSEAEKVLVLEFNTLTKNLNKNVAVLTKARKGKLTAAEKELITQIGKDVKHAQVRVSKEIGDIDDIINK